MADSDEDVLERFGRGDHDEDVEAPADAEDEVLTLEDDDDAPPSDSMKTLLAGYYGIAPDANGDGKLDDGDDAESVAPKPTRPQDLTDVTSRFFDAELYVSKILKEKGMGELIDLDNDMRSSARSLDSEMQMLVYENYNKFISATDMIRKMKDNVVSMEEEMSNLLANMDRISDSCGHLETELTPNRQKVEQLVGVSRLIKRLEFLFELPTRLKQSISMGAYSTAVKYFCKANLILQQYNHLASFESIRKESESTIKGLKVILRQVVRDPTQNHLTQLEHSGLLVQLGEAPEGLLPDILQARRTRLQSDMREAVEFVRSEEKRIEELKAKQEAANAAAAAQKQAAEEEAKRLAAEKKEQERKEKEKEEAAKADGDKNGAKKEEELNPWKRKPKKDDKKEDGSSAGAGGKGKADKNAGADIPEPPSLIGVLEKGFLHSFLMFAQSFTDSFIKPYANDKRSQGVVEKCSKALNDFTTEVFTEYFSITRKELLNHANVRNKPHSEIKKDALAIASLTTTLRDFYQSLRKASAFVPRAHLLDRAEEIVRHAVRHCAESVFDKALSNIVDLLKAMHGQLGPTPLLLSYLQHEEKEKSTDNRIAKYAKYGLQIRQILEDAISILVPILSTRDYLMDANGAEYIDLAHGHFHQLLNSLSNVLLCGVPRESDGPVYKPSPPSAFADLSTLKEQEHPKFYLIISRICLHLQQTEIPSALNHLKACFPLPVDPSAKNKRRDAGLSMFEHDVPKLLNRLRESAQLLFDHYVEIHGLKLTRLLRARELEHAASLSDDQGHPAQPVITEVQNEIQKIQHELAAIFPPRAQGTAPVEPAGPSPNPPPLVNRPSLAAIPQVNADSRERTLKREMERMFTQKITIFAPSKFNRVSPLSTILRIAFKTLVEQVRLIPVVTTNVYRQLQIDIGALRSAVPSYLPPELRDPLMQLLDEVLNGAVDRADKNAALPGPPTPTHDARSIVSDLPLSVVGGGPSLSSGSVSGIETETDTYMDGENGQEDDS